MNTTLKDLIEFINYGEVYLEKNPKERSKLTLALEKLLKKYRKIVTDAQVDLEDEKEMIRAERCEKDKDGFFIEKTYGQGDNLRVLKKFKPEQEKELKKDIKKMEEKFLSDEVSVPVHLVDVPKSINYRYINPFKGFLFSVTEEEADAIYLAQAEEEK